MVEKQEERLPYCSRILLEVIGIFHCPLGFEQAPARDCSQGFDSGDFVVIAPLALKIIVIGLSQVVGQPVNGGNATHTNG